MKQFLLSFLLTSLSTSILVLLLSLIFTLFKTRISARAKYFIWFLVLLSFLLPFRPQFGSGLIRMNTSPTVETAVSSVQSATSQGASQVSTKVAQTGLWDTISSLPWFEILLFIWLLGFVISLGRYAYSYIRFRKMLKRWGTPVQDEEAFLQLQMIQQEMGVRRKVSLLHYPMSQSPMLLGFRDILIVLPELDYTEEELQLIFKHELTHYKHRDVLINLLSMLVKSLHWFNPIVRLACREMQEVGEMYCDYDVLNNRDTSYRTIIGIMDSRLPKKFLSTGFIIAVSFLLLLTSSVFAIENSVTKVQKTQTVTRKKESQEVTQNQALSVVLKDLSLTEKEIKDLKIVREKDNYQIYFSHGQTAHEILVNAKTGKILKSKQHTVVEKTVTVEKEAPSSSQSTTDGNQTVVTPPSSSASPVVNSSPSTNQTSSSQDTDDDDDDKDDDDD